MTQTLLAQRWKKFLNPVFTPVTGLLFFSVIIFHYHYPGWRHPLHRGHIDEKIMWLFYVYAPFVLAACFVRIRGMYAGFAAFVAFACTLFGIVYLEVSLMKGVRRPDALDLCMHAFSTIQAAVLTYRLVMQFRTPGGIFQSPKEMHLEPEPLLALLILALVGGLTLLGKHTLGMKPAQVSEMTVIAGLLLIYLFGLFGKKEKPL